MLNSQEKNEIKKIIIKNALDYGKARKETAINKILSKFPELRRDIKTLSSYIEMVVVDINLLSDTQLKEEASKFSEEYKLEEEARLEKTARPHFFLEGATVSNFMTRFPPEPNGPMQIGHAKVAFTEKEFADMYNGKLALYFDDTNPDTEKQEFVDMMKRDLEWLGIAYDLEYYASDNIRLMYELAEKLIAKDKAYVCSCSPEDVKKSRVSGIDCKHKKQKTYENISLWKEMLSSQNSQESILRLNYDLKSLNTAMRDPTLFRIKNNKHYRQGTKYQIWPTYAFNTPIIDSIKGITDVIRSKEFELLDELYFYILDSLEMRKPRIHSISRLEIRDNLTSKRKINELMKEGLLWGYDDPRLVTIAGLRRRGVMPKAIKEFSMRFGMSKTESIVDINILLSENKKIIDSHSKRLFYVEKPFKITVNGIPEEKKQIKIKLHPTTELGYRNYLLTNVFFINAYDANNLSINGDLKLKDAFDIKIENIENREATARYIDKQTHPSLKVQWVNEGNLMKCNIYEIGNLLDGDLFNNNSMILKEGYIENYAESMNLGETAQFERVGFFKLDKKEGQLNFISL